MDLPQLDALNEKRRTIRHLLSPTDPADALTSYYALWHDPRRTQLTLHYDDRHRADGFATVAQTGADLFRPLVTLRAPGEATVADLLRAALVSNRSYYLIAPITLASAIRDQITFKQSGLNCIYVLDPARFQPIINVLVQQAGAADGAPRFEIESQGETMAMSGTNWRSPTFAEVFVYAHPSARSRGWGKSVVSACTAALLEEKLRPLYIVEEENEASIRTAEAVGYVDTGLREFAGEGSLK
jgi:GNAT superfamily N-acetyltransferase